jgi:broad specificity phosphatase PhoE
VAGIHGLEVQPDQRLREIDTGDWTGLGRDEIERHYPGGLKTWSETPSTMRMPNGETIEEAQARALAFFAERMPAHSGQTIVVISHGAVTQAILIEAMGGSVTDLWLKQRVDNTQLSRLEWTAERGLQVIELADVKHLEDVGSLIGWRTTDAA